MQGRCNQTLLSLLFGCLACLAVTSVVNADGKLILHLLSQKTIGLTHMIEMCHDLLSNPFKWRY